MARNLPAVFALRRLFPFYRPYRMMVSGGILLVIVSSATSSVVPLLLKNGIDSERAGAPLPHVILIGATIVLVALATGAIRYWMREILNGLSRYIEYDLRQALFVRMTSLDAPFYGRMRTGDLMARLTNDLSAVRMAAGPAIMYLASTVFAAAFALFFMARIDGRLTVLALAPMVALPVITVWLGGAIHTRFEAVQVHFSTMTTQVQENLSGVRVVRAYRQEKSETARFLALNDIYVDRNLALARLYGAMHPMFGLLGGLSVAVVLGIGGSLVVRGTITVGDFVAFNFYLASLIWPMIALGWVTNLFQRGAASMTRLLDILDATSELTQPLSPRRLEPVRAGRSIEFRDVGFHYPTSGGGHPRWVLRHVSFTIGAGETLAIVGATGSGKSALIDLIPRVRDPQEGEILIDGVPIRELSISGLRAEIGYVPQESFLFSDTIASNLAYGDATHALVEREIGDEKLAPESRELGATAADAYVWAAGVAQLDETVQEFSHGYGTLLGERGINLSGGQKQRLALARALARKPHIVLLDDALSAVDTHTEAAILHGLESTLEGRTAVIASHRVSAVRSATWIIVLADGQVVEAGRHEDLIVAGKRYAALLSRQQLEESIESETATVM